MKSKKNKGFQKDPSLSLKNNDLQKGIDAYRDWHWGIEPDRAVNWDDSDIPEFLIECGRLIRIYIRPPQVQGNRKHPRRIKDTSITFSRKVAERSHLAYDPDHPDQRLYILIDPQACEALAERFWDQNSMPEMNLNDLAAILGGRHGRRRDYPDIQVKPIGAVTAIAYFTNKEGDGPSYYVHVMSENSQMPPALACDESGRLWLAGSTYTVPTPGITD